MSIMRSIRTLALAGSLAAAVVGTGSLAQPAAASNGSTDPLTGRWLATSYGSGGATSASAIVEFHKDGRATVSPVAGMIPQSTGDWGAAGDGTYIHVSYAFRSGPGGALEIERTRSVLVYDGRSNSWVTRESYSQFLNPATLDVIAAQQGTLVRAVSLTTAASSAR